MQTGDYKNYIILQEKNYKLANEANYQDGKAICYLNLFIINYNLNNSKNAWFFLQKAENIIKKSEDPFHKAMLSSAYATYYAFFNLSEVSLQNCDIAINILEKKNRSKLRDLLLSNVYQTKGLFFYDKTQYDAAFVYFNKAERLVKDPYIICLLANHYLRFNHMDSAKVYIQQANQIINKKTTSDLHAFYAYLTVGYYYFKTNNYIKAEEEYLKAKEKSNKVFPSYGYPIQLYQRLSELYEKMGNKDLAYYYVGKFNAANQNILKDKSQNTNLAIEEFIKKLKNDDDSEENRFLIFSVVCAVVFFTICLYIYKHIIFLQSRKKILNYEALTLKEHIYDKKYDELIAMAKSNDSAFLMKFREVYPEFIAKLLKINPDLENSELAFCSLIKLNFTSKEIALYTFVQPTSVHQRKRRLRRRLNVPNGTDLYKFFNDL
ncbi:tetratricopeptide repeat protein [Elizabethkingia anophelis]|uniref:tetratricopeptide repeat protein n=1 Tax=Elizabethkingia anophelis TaxID=1117645 RepID=UPI0038926222